MVEKIVDDTYKIQICTNCNFTVVYKKDQTTGGWKLDKDCESEFIKASTMSIYNYKDNDPVRIFLCPKCGAAGMKVKVK